MTTTPSRLLLLPFAALGDDAALGVWARQLPQLLAALLPAEAGATALTWRDSVTGRLVRATGALPPSVVAGEAEAAGCSTVLTGSVRRVDEGVALDVAVGPAASEPTDRMSEVLTPGREAEGVAALLRSLLQRLELSADASAPPAPLWPYLCDLEVESELLRAGTAALGDVSDGWRHLRAAAGTGAAWSNQRLVNRRTLLSRVAPELLAAFDAESRPAAIRDYSTDDVLQLLGIESRTNSSSAQG